MLSLLQINEQCAGRCHTEREIVYGKPFQGIDAQLFFQLFNG